RADRKSWRGSAGRKEKREEYKKKINSHMNLGKTDYFTNGIRRPNRMKEVSRRDPRAAEARSFRNRKIVKLESSFNFMPARILSGKPIADQIKAEVAAEVSKLHDEHGFTRCLVAVRVGENPASEVY